VVRCAGDVVLAVDGHPISNGADLAAKIGSMAPGTTVQISIFRDGGERTIPVTLVELPGTPFKPAFAANAVGGCDGGRVAGRGEQAHCSTG
jgi:serine protease Do